MSSRVLRKLQGEAEGAEGRDGRPEADQDEEDLAVTRGAKPRRPNLNPFELLNRESQSESEVKEDDDLGTESSRSALKREDTKKKRKKKTRKKGGRNDFKSSEDNQEGEDEIDRSVREVNRILGAAQAAGGAKPAVPKAAAASTPQSLLRSLLSIEYRHLNPENEMKKIFGSRVVQAEARHLHHHHRRGHHGQRVRAPVRSAHSVLAPKGHWPNPNKHGGGLAMRFVDSDADGNQFFAFEHSKEYQRVQEEFFMAVQTMNPDAIVQILNVHPFHIDGMLQLSDICKMGEDVQMATELIERVLFAMETAFHPLFNLAVGTCRLDYRRQENRAFFIALFRHLNFVGSRACYRTSLEFAKLLYNLDPDADPAGVLLLMDFYAIKAQQYQWFVKMFEQLEAMGRNVSQLPNWAYGVAVAHFYLSQEKDEEKTRQEHAKKADELLQSALIMFPGVLLSILDKCSVDASGAVTKHKFFLEAQIKQHPGLELLCRLYVGRSHHIWKAPELLPWLESNANAVVAKVDGNDPAVQSAEAKRKTRYQGVPRNIHRHVIMSDIPDATTSLPKELADTPVLSYDPLPPTDSVDLYSADKQRGRRGPEDEGSLSLFFRSMLPNFDPNAPAPEGNNDDPENRGASLRSTVDNLYEAMQDLLRNLHLPEIPHEGADTEDSDDEQENNADWE